MRCAVVWKSDSRTRKIHTGMALGGRDGWNETKAKIARLTHYSEKQPRPNPEPKF